MQLSIVSHDLKVAKFSYNKVYEEKTIHCFKVLLRHFRISLEMNSFSKKSRNPTKKIKYKI